MIPTLVTYYSFPPDAFSWLDFPNLYQTLGVRSDATQKEIRSRHRALVQTWHPDKAKQHGIDGYSANIITEVINRAAEVLGDNETRMDYDTGRLDVYVCACFLCFHCL